MTAAMVTASRGWAMTNDTNSDRILRKIEKCLALSRSPNEHEAGIALRHAQQLMEEHGINGTDIAVSNINRVAVRSVGGQKPPRWLDNLASLINAAFGTLTVYETSRMHDGWESYYAFLGEHSQVRIASYSFEVLQRQLVKDRSSFLSKMSKRAKRLTKIRRADAYALAWVAGANAHITAVKKTDETVMAIKQFKENHYDSLKPMSSIDRGQRSNDKKSNFSRL